MQHIHDLVFLRSSNGKGRNFWCIFISQQGASGAERRKHCLIRTQKYTHVVLSHKVKEIWSHPEVGRGGVREPENFLQSKKHPGSWVFCFLRRDRLLCTAERNDRDWLCVKQLHTGTALWVGCVLLFSFMGNRATTNHVEKPHNGRKCPTQRRIGMKATRLELSEQRLQWIIVIIAET